MIPVNNHSPLTAAWYEQRILGSIASYDKDCQQTHIGELRGIANALVRRVADLEKLTNPNPDRVTNY